MVTCLRLAVDAWPVVVVAILTCPTTGRFFPPANPPIVLQSFTRDAPFSYGDGYAVFEGPFGRSPGRTKFAEPNNDRFMRFIHRWSSRPPLHFLFIFGGARAQRSTSPYAPPFPPTIRH